MIEVARSERRRFRRVAAVGRASVEVGSLSLPVEDLSAEGVAVVVPPGADLPRAGFTARLRAGEVALRCRAETLRAQSAAIGSARAVLHLEPEESGQLLELYHRLRFPALSRRGQRPSQAVVDLFRRSGYLALKAELVPSPEWLAARWPETLTREAVYTAADGSLLGHIGITRAYSRAWLGHEIATLRDHPEALTCRRALYHHYANWPRLLDGDQALVLGYYNRGRPWHQRMFEGYAASLPDDLCAVHPLDRFRVRPEAPVDEPVGVVVDRLQAEEAAALVRVIASRWPALLRAAFDIDENNLTSCCLHRAYADAGLERSRTVLALRREGRLIGAALCESTSGELSLFNVLNAAQLFLVPDSEPTEGERRALILAVRRFFRERGVEAPLVVADPSVMPEDRAAGLELCETMGCIVWSAPALRDYDDYVDETIAGHPTRGERS